MFDKIELYYRQKFRQTKIKGETELLRIFIKQNTQTSAVVALFIIHLMMFGLKNLPSTIPRKHVLTSSPGLVEKLDGECCGLLAAKESNIII